MINEEHLNLLKDVGAFQRVNQKKFDERLEELRAFKEKYGTCKVPYSGDTMVLATWVLNIRCACKKFQQGDYTNRLINKERFKQFKELDGLQSDDKLFEDWIEELKSYKARYGT